MNKKLKRAMSLMPDGVPRYVRCYDGADTADRYTIVFTGHYPGRAPGEHTYVGSSANPFHPQGFYQHGGANAPIDQPSYAHLGKKIKFTDLPKDVRSAVISDYKDLWKIEFLTEELLSNDTVNSYHEEFAKAATYIPKGKMYQIQVGGETLVADNPNTLLRKFAFIKLFNSYD